MLHSKFGYESYCSLAGVNCAPNNPLAPGAKPLRNDSATRGNIERVADALRDFLCPNDDVIFFYSGHGDYRPDFSNPGNPAKGTGYLIPVDAPANDQHIYSEFIPVRDLLDALGGSRAQNVLVILDACYSGIAIEDSLNTSMGGNTEIANDQQFIDSMAKKKSRKVITAALPQQTASAQGPRAGNSLFTGVLLDELETGQAAGRHSFIYSTGLGAELKTEVTIASASAQTADFGRFDGDDFGELILPLDLNYESLCHNALSALADGDVDTFSVRAKQAIQREPENPMSVYLNYRMAVEESNPEDALKFSSDLMALPPASLPLRLDESESVGPRDLRMMRRQVQFWQEALKILPTASSRAQVRIKLYIGETEKNLIPLEADQAYTVPPNANLFFRMAGPLKDVYIYAFMVDGKGLITPSADLIDSRQASTGDEFTSGAQAGPDLSDSQEWHFLISDHAIDGYANPPSATSAGSGDAVGADALKGVQHVVVRVKAGNQPAS
jgi:hypothetical protein